MLISGCKLNPNSPVTLEPDGYNALHVCSMLNFPHAVMVLLRMQGVDVNKRDNKGRSALDLARRTASQNVVELLTKMTTI